MRWGVFTWLAAGLMFTHMAAAHADRPHDSPVSGQASQQVYADLTEPAYQSMITGLAAQELQLVSAHAWQGPSGLRFSAVVERAVPGRVWLARHGQTNAEARAFIDLYVGRQGWSLRALNVYRTDAGYRYLVVVDDQPRTGAYHRPILAVSGQDWQSVFNEQVSNGRYPERVSMASDGRGRLVVTAHFVPANGVQFLAWQGRTQRQFIRDHRQAVRQGFHPVSFLSFPGADGQVSYSGVWTNTAPAADVLLNVSADRLAPILATLHSQGRSIRHISVAGDRRGRPVYSLHVSRGPNQAALDPDGADFPINTRTGGPGAAPGGGTSPGGNGTSGSGGSGRDFAGGFSGGTRVVPGSGGGGAGGGGPGGGGGGDDGGGNGGGIPGQPVQPGDPDWCNYYTFGGSHVGLTIRSPSDSPLVSRNWGVSYCDDELHRSEVNRGRRAEDHYLGIRVPWAQATNVSEAATCLRNHRRMWIWEASDDPETRRGWEQVGGSIWDGIDGEACEACGRMIAIAGMNYCRNYGYEPR